jgi:hypothetical protein
MKYPIGEYVPLTWDGDGKPSAYYVAGHVTPDEFRAEIVRWFSGKVVVPPDAKIEHVYIRSVRVGNDDWGNRAYEWRHQPAGHPMTYWEVEPNRATEGVSDFDALLAKSSIGKGLADIKEQGVDAHLVDLEKELAAAELTGLLVVPVASNESPNAPLHVFDPPIRIASEDEEKQ